MIEFEVEIKGRPIGVRFAHADRGETVIVHLVLENQLGHQLGLLPGDILIAMNGKSILETSSSVALDLFRNTPTPFKASFRRFEDDDDFDTDRENSANDQESEHTFMKEDASSIMQALSVTPMTSNAKSVNVVEWNNEEVCEWLVNYGKLLNKQNVYEKYLKIFQQKQITGKQLRAFDKNDLLKMGIDEKDYLELFSGIQQLNRIAPSSSQPVKKPSENTEDDIVDDINDTNNQNNDNNNDNDNDNDNDDKENANDNDNDNNNAYEQPFLPYMYNAPSIKLSEKTKVNVYSARVVAPYKKRPFALYEVEVVDGDNEWLLSKRYTEFLRLHEAVSLSCECIHSQSMLYTNYHIGLMYQIFLLVFVFSFFCVQNG